MKNFLSRLLLPVVLSCAVFLLGSFPLSAADPFPGNPPLTPYWALGHWVWEDNTNTQASTIKLVNDYKSRNIPVTTVIVDSPWETYYNTFIPDQTRYSNFQQMITDFHAQGVRLICWHTTWINTNSPDYTFVKNSKYIVDPAAGNMSWWKGTGVHLDHTNPAAQAWLDGKMDNMLNMGLDGWKMDMGPDMLSSYSQTVTLSAGSTKGTTMPLIDFQKYYYQTVYDHAIAKNPENVITARGYAGTQSGTENKSSISKNPLCWQGDFGGDFAGLANQAGYVYQTAINGYGCPGVEVGGYAAPAASKNSLVRYAQFGALTPYMENGGENGGLSNHLPWYWDQQTTDIYRYFATLHCELAPYNFSGIVDCHINGGSQMKSCDKTNWTHKLGKDIFVGILTSDVLSRNVTFPANDKWIDYWNENTSNTIYSGGTTKTGYSAPLNQFPIFIRAGAIIPMNVTTNVTSHGDVNSAGKTTVLFYPYGTSTLTFHRPTGAGVGFEDVTITMDEVNGTITVSGPTAVDYRFRVKAFSAPAGVTGATSYSYDATNKVLTIDKSGAASFTITIATLVSYSNLIGGDPCMGVTGGGSGLQGTTFGLNPPYATGFEYCRAFDGNINTYYDAQDPNNGYSGLDLGTAMVISSIKYYPRSGQTARMTNGKFQGSNASSTSGYVDLFTISGNPPLQWNTISLSNSTAYRWVRYLSPANGYCDIAEMEFYQAATPVTIEAENASPSASAAGFNVSTGDANNSNSAYVQFNAAPVVGDWLQFTLANLTGATYAIKMYFKANTNRGICQGSVDGVNLGPTCDEYRTAAAYKVMHDMGNVPLTSGNHSIRFSIIGKNAASAGYTMTVDKIVLSPVSTQNYTLTSSATNGTISLNPAGGAYASGTVVTLTATPATGFTFSGWSGDLTGMTNPATITMNGNKTVTATFTSIPQYTLTTSATNGSVALNPAGGIYNAGAVVTLTATPSAGYTFSGWSGDLSGTTNPVTLTMNTDKSVTASFTVIPQYTLTTSATNGTIALIPSGGTYQSGTVVTLTATPVGGYAFSGWSGDLSGTTNPATITMNGNTSVTANFTLNPTTITFEAENLARAASAAGSQVVTGAISASNNSYVQFAGTPVAGDWLEFTLPGLAAGTYTIKMYFKSNNNRCNCQGTVDGVTLGAPCDEYQVTATQQVMFTLGNMALTAMDHKIRFTVTGKNPASSGYTMTIDKIVLTRQ